MDDEPIPFRRLVAFHATQLYYSAAVSVLFTGCDALPIPQQRRVHGGACISAITTCLSAGRSYTQNEYKTCSSGSSGDKHRRQ
ncbi:predicted protein [Arabidopsis lyrata subsp. lyrata]|uniref:Predicted protein n=1 Tax=Arabidopsis lyrata subsp. lyrata TaxID=81972 RepID=D7LQ35_ARALL|nr:predicted protein [Arabidopsis lyrata subsp. lyrata]